MTKGGTIRVLVVDDNAVDRERVRRLLGRGYEVCEGGTSAEALALLTDCEVDCALLDQQLPDTDGLEIISTLVARGLPVLMLTGQGNEALAVEAMKRGARDYLVKRELTSDSLRRSIEHALERGRLEAELAANQRQLAAHAAELASRRAELEASNAALAEREARLRVVLQQLPGIVWTTDSALTYTSADGAGLRDLGVTEPDFMGAPVTGLVPGTVGDADAIVAHRSALAGESARFEARVNRRIYECQVEPLRAMDGPICGVIGVALDETEARRLAEDLRQSQKMESIGMLAGGVAHDFNNILTVILSFSEFVREAVPKGSEASADLEQITIAAERARKLVGQLLAFSRRRPVEPRVLEPARVITEMLPMLRRLLGEDIELRLEADVSPWNVRIDPNELEQVITNLAVNARDAMPRGGRLQIAVENLGYHDELQLNHGRRVDPGEHVVISVTDNGSGMAPEVLQRIFEPFFTTKDVGRGTGLGLSTSEGIVSQGGGTLSVQSELGRGTTFSIYLPRVKASVDEISLLRDEPVRGGSERVLVAEDDDQVRAVVVRILGSLGYQVVEARNGLEALDLIERSQPAIDLVLSDVVMPEAGGFEILETLRARATSPRIILMSGYNEERVHRHELLRGSTLLIKKPISQDVLARKIRSMLDAPVPSSA